MAVCFKSVTNTYEPEEGNLITTDRCVGPYKLWLFFFYRNNVEIKRYKTWLVLKCDLNARAEMRMVK